MSKDKWKDFLLKSSLPLEHVVAEQLVNLDWEVWGQYNYARNNESGMRTDFSVDIEAHKEYSTDTHWLCSFELLIECKYAAPGIKWVFLPYPETSEVLWDTPVYIFDKVTNKRITDRHLLNTVEDDMPYCIRGIALRDNGFDETPISKGANQLRYAMPRLAIEAISNQLTSTHDADICITIACAILVTTAPIFALKEGLTLDEVSRAESLDDVVIEHESIILWDSHAPDRSNYAEGLFKELDADTLGIRLEKYIEAFQPSKNVTSSPYLHSDPIQPVRRAISRAGDHVIVVTLKHLESFLVRLEEGVASAVESIECITSIDDFD